MHFYQPKLPAQGALNRNLLEHTLLWRASQQLSQNAKVHPEMTALTLLAGISAVAQGLYDVQLPYGVIRPTSINVVISLESGGGKSVVFEKVMGPIQEVQREHRRCLNQSIAVRNSEKDAGVIDIQGGSNGVQ